MVSRVSLCWQALEMDHHELGQPNSLESILRNTFRLIIDRPLGNFNPLHSPFLCPTPLYIAITYEKVVHIKTFLYLICTNGGTVCQ